MVERNLNALERILRELEVGCDVRQPETIAKLYNLTYSVKLHHRTRPRTEGLEFGRLRTKRQQVNAVFFQSIINISESMNYR